MSRILAGVIVVLLTSLSGLGWLYHRAETRIEQLAQDKATLQGNFEAAQQQISAWEQTTLRLDGELKERARRLVLRDAELKRLRAENDSRKRRFQRAQNEDPKVEEWAGTQHPAFISDSLRRLSGTAGGEGPGVDRTTTGPGAAGADDGAKVLR